MSGGAAPLAVFLLAVLAAGNPTARAASLVARPGSGSGDAAPAHGHPSDPAPPSAIVGAAAFVGVVLVAVALAAGRLLDALDVSPPTARLAAGLVLAAVALVQVVGPEPGPLPDTAERWGALVPLAFPHLLRPELVLVVLSAGADHGGGAAATLSLVPLVLSVGAVAAVGRPTTGPRLLAPLSRMTAAVGVLVGVDLVVDGIVAL